MKTIPLTLIDAYAKHGSSTCFLVKIVCKDDSVHGFTTLDASLTFDDGIHVLLYKATEELSPQNIQEELNLDVDNTDLVGWFSEALEQLVLAGKFDLAEITIYRIAYLRRDAGFEVMGYGTVGEVQFSVDTKSKRKVEFRSLKQQLKQKVNEQYSLTCRNDFGDELCGMPFVWHHGTVDSVGLSAFLNFKVTGIAQPDRYFELGVVEFTSGDNIGAQLEIESWASDGTIQLSFLAPYAIQPTDAVRIRQDCGKTETDCKGYNNIRNMNAEHLTPVQDQSIMVPGAYIKSQGAK